MGAFKNAQSFAWGLQSLCMRAYIVCGLCLPWVYRCGSKACRQLHNTPPNHSLYTHSEVNSLDFPAGPSTGPLMVWSAMICGWEEQIQGGGRGRQRLGAHGGFVRSRAERKSLRMAQVVHEHKQPGRMRMCSRQGALSLRC